MVKNKGIKALIYILLSLSGVCTLTTSHALYQEKMQRAQNLGAMENLLREVQTTFRMQGKPISPLILQFFQNPISDLAEPYRLALDLNMAFSTNLFPSHATAGSKDGWILSPLPDNGFFKYQYIGRLRNGLHIVVCSENLGGTLTLYTLNAFSISLDWALDSTGKPYIRLKMELYFQTPLDYFEKAVVDNNSNIVHVFYGDHKRSHTIESPRKLVDLN